jgi:pre-mRNA-splicing factor SYF1
LFEKARDIFEESLEKILTARDFGIVYNAYLKFEEEMLNLMAEEEDEDQIQEKQQDTELVNEID